MNEELASAIESRFSDQPANNGNQVAIIEGQTASGAEIFTQNISVTQPESKWWIWVIAALVVIFIFKRELARL